MRAVVDIGTNSVRLAWQRSIDAPMLEDLRYTRLGADMIEGRLAAASLERTLVGIKELLALLPAALQSQVLITATSAIREAINRSEAITTIEAALGLPLKILSTDEEAQFGFWGALRGTDPSTHATAAVLDIGGGSTELTFGGSMLQSVSVAVGAVRLHERRVQYEPLTTTLAPLTGGHTSWSGTLIGTGGTITSVGAIDVAMATYDAAALHGHPLNLEAISAWQERLALMTVAQRKLVPGLPPARADIILEGMDILCTVMQQLEVTTITVSTSDMLHALLETQPDR